MLEEYVIDVHDRCNHEQIIKLSGVKEVSGGMCFLLAVNWLWDCSGGGLPTAVWHEMKGKGPAYFRQIAHQQSNYQSLSHLSPKDNGWYGSIRECVELATAKGLQAGSAIMPIPDAASLAADLGRILDCPDARPNGALVSLFGGWGGHAIGATKVDGVFYLFDANYGVMTVHATKIGTAIGEMWNKYSPDVGGMVSIA